MGGLVGAEYANSEIRTSYALGNVFTGDTGYVGGFAAYASGNIQDAFAMGHVQSGNASYIGGFLGEFGGILKNVYSRGFIVAGSNSHTGGLVGDNFGSQELTSSYWDLESSGMSSDAHSESIGLTSVQMKNQSNYIDWDFNSTWNMDEEDGAPSLFMTLPLLSTWIPSDTLLKPNLVHNRTRTIGLRWMDHGLQVNGERGVVFIYDLNGKLIWKRMIDADGFYPIAWNKSLFTMRFISERR